jgi:putative flippase GtrA
MSVAPSTRETTGQPSRTFSVRLRRLILQFGRYGVVSILALATDFGIFLALTFSGMQASRAGIIGYTVGLVLHYFLSTRYVFVANTSQKPTWRVFGEFALSGLVGLAITAVTIDVAMRSFHAPAVVAKVLAVGVSFTFVFLLRRQVVFRKRVSAA